MYVHAIDWRGIIKDSAIQRVTQKFYIVFSSRRPLKKRLRNPTYLYTSCLISPAQTDHAVFLPRRYYCTYKDILFNYFLLPVLTALRAWLTVICPVTCIRTLVCGLVWICAAETTAVGTVLEFTATPFPWSF